MELLCYFIAVSVISAGLFLGRNKVLQIVLISAFVAVQTGFMLILFQKPDVHWSEYFYNDALARIFISILTITSIFAIINSFVYFKHRHEKILLKSIYLGSLTAFFACMTGIFLADNAGILWALTEATTLCIAVLIYHERTKESIEATWKYVFVSTIGLSFSFIGIILLDMSSLNLNPAGFSFSALLSQPVTIENTLLFQVSFLLILIGFSVKMGVFPLHTVCIDAHSVAPSPVSALISTSLMNVGFVAVFRFFKIFAGTSVYDWATHVLYIIGVLSILFAAVYMLKVKNYKRLIAYSSVEHMGLTALGLATGGIAWFAVVLHLTYHSFTKSSLFFQIAQVIRMYHTKKMYGIGSYFKLNPVGGIVLLLGFVLIMGIPPSGMFFTEFLIFKSMVEAGNIWMTVGVVILLTIIIWMFAKNLFRILFKQISPEKEAAIKPISWWESVPQLILLLFTLYISINPPEFLLNLINEAVKTVSVL